MPSKRTKKKQKTKSLASQADRHRLYELSVQSPPEEVDFIQDTFRDIRGRKAHRLREDFCGTAGVCCEWVGRSKKNRAIGVDWDPDVLGWGKANNLSKLSGNEKKRVSLLQEDVLRARTDPVDVVAAMNFSYWLLDDRKSLKRYFKSVRRALVEDGIFFLDAYGGYDSFREIEEDREIAEDGYEFTYIWDQANFNPITNHLKCHIHFSFADGSHLDRAFSYKWRMWTLPEIKDLLEECRFRNVTFFWQGFDADGEANGEFAPVTEADADAGWICYITAER
ncbi:MAG: class I SAM-dependent methyltransferase [Pseudomonadota bacterium]